MAPIPDTYLDLVQQKKASADLATATRTQVGDAPPSRIARTML
jgi:hypothetical protein